MALFSFLLFFLPRNGIDESFDRRPPYGDVDNRIRTIAAGLNLTTIVWSDDTVSFSFPLRSVMLRLVSTFIPLIIDSWEKRLLVEGVSAFKRSLETTNSSNYCLNASGPDCRFVLTFAIIGGLESRGHYRRRDTSGCRCELSGHHQQDDEWDLCNTRPGSPKS